jgi:hypothetical protein
MLVSAETVRRQPYLPYRVTSDSLRAFARQQARVLDPGWGTPLNSLSLGEGQWPRAAGFSVAPIYELEPPDDCTIDSSVKVVAIDLPYRAGILIRRVQEPKLHHPDAAIVGMKVVVIGLSDDCKLILVRKQIEPEQPYLELTVSGPDAAVAAVIAAFRQTFAVKVPFLSQISVHTALDFEANPQIGIVRWGSKYR